MKRKGIQLLAMFLAMVLLIASLAIPVSATWTYPDGGTLTGTVGGRGITPNKTIYIYHKDSSGNLLKYCEYKTDNDDYYCHGDSLYGYDIIGFSSNQGLGESCVLTWAAGNDSKAGYAQIGWQFYKIIGGKSITCNVTYQKQEPTKFTINHYTIDKNGSKTLYSSSTSSYTYGNSMYIGRVYPTGYSLEDGYLSSISGTFTYDVLDAGKNVDTRLYYNYHQGSRRGDMYDRKSYTYSSKDYIDYCDNREIKVTFLYRINSYTISFDANGGSGAPEAVTKYYGDTLTLPSTTPTRSGYTFQGWGTSASSTSASYQPGGSYTSNSAITLYAVWKSNAPTTYTVSYNANGGSGAPSSQTKTKDVTLTLSSTKPTRSGYTFKGWSTSSTATSATYQPGGSYTSNAAVTLYAVWQKNATTYSVTYNANGGSGAPGTQTKTENVTLTLSSTKPTRSGYTFKGWATSSTATVASYQPGSSYTANAKVTLYAVWSKNPSQYTVSYNANGGSGAPPSQTKTEGVALTLSATKPTRSGYTFLGWSTSSTAISATYSAGGSYTANAGATLYAVWSCNHTTTSRVYVTGCDWEQRCDQCGAVTSTGTTHGPYSYGDWTYYSSAQHKRVKSCDYGDYSTNEYASHNTEKRYSQYNSSQHAVNQYCTDCKTNIGSTTYESHNFVATVGTASTVYRCSQCQYSYEVANTYTVTYNANGGTGAPGAQVKTHGENLTLSSVKPSKSNCVFLGWNTQSTATVSQYSAGSTYTDNKSITLYAVWEKAKYDFSISNLTIGESSIYRYGTTTVRVRVDSWDKVNSYSGIPVELLYDGIVVGTQTVNLPAYGIAYVTFNLNVGNTVGSHSVSARVNWNNHMSEDNTANNTVSGSLNVLDYDYEMSVGSVALNSSYCEGTTVISSFTVNNDSDVDILPSHHNSASFSAYYYNGSTKVVIWTDKKTDVVIPSGGSNLVYFKWTVPSGLTGKTVYCECTVNSDNSLNEENRNNNTVVFQTVIKSVLESQTPDTRYERTAPANYSASAPIPANNRTGFSWTEWKYENGAFVLKTYGIRVNSAIPTLKPDVSCPTAEMTNGHWTIKSGYGITLEWTPAIIAESGCSMPSSDCYTGIQYAYATYPEYRYEMALNCCDNLDLIGNKYCFRQNADADGYARVHFIPVYVGDGSYSVSISAAGIWTPAGMISITVNSDTLEVSGSIYDDYYVGN